MKRHLSILCTIAAAVLLSCSCGVRRYGVEVVAEYPHDVTSYTQGLFFHEGQLYESTGMKGESTFRKVELETGRALRRLDFDREWFIEGSCVFRDSLYILSWENQAAFKYDIDSLRFSSSWSYPREGWGLTTDGEFLIASDGSAHLYFMDDNFKVQKRLLVKKDGHPMRWLNELEYIDGKVWANVYTTDIIVVIDPRSGDVEAEIDCSGLLDDALRDSRTDVLNGIACNPEDGRIYLTGKYWPRLYEIRLVPKK